VSNYVDVVMAGKDLPDSYEGWEKLARATLDDERFRYVTSGAGYGETVRANLDAFRKWRIIPRVLRDVGNRSAAVTLLRTVASAPIFLSPVRGLGYIRRDGDFAVARVAAELGIPIVVSTFATTSIEGIAQAMGRGSRWFQLYPGKDQEIAQSLVRRAEASGYSAIVVTVDKAESYPHYDGPHGHEFDQHGHEVYFSDPVFRSKFGGVPERHFETAWKMWKEIRLAPGFSLANLSLITGQTKLPVIVKGILNPEDAELAAEHGASGVIVSNHGGRSLDGEVASLDALVEVRKVVKKDFPVLMDGGVRSGADVLKALALGANAVMIGKVYALGLGASGEEGVRRVLKGLVGEFEAAMGLCGAVTVGEINRSMVTQA
jgi:isopentenyl diphosphate isomerase/L-lactate dehydrogenase-like FMN-dependent dehydrogenase